jgi:tRNA(Ile)-lysidine synthase
MLEKFEQHIANNFSFLKNKKVLVAVSGGVDSVVLTMLLHKLNIPISLAHCNFKLRENDSDLDEQFVKNLGDKLNVKSFSIQFDTEKYASENKLSIQLAARELRYNWFEEIIRKNKIDFIATAHHADDNIETFLINLTRGTGLDGLTGIPQQNKNIIRPLLPFSREEILGFAKKNKINWREDASNASTKYLRNKFRHDVVPILKEINPSLIESFNNTISHLKESQQIVEDRIKIVSDDIVETENDVKKISIEKLLKLSNPKAYLFQLLKDYGFNEWDKVYNLVFAQSGKFISTNSHRLLKNRDFLLFSPTVDSSETSQSVFEIHEDTEFVEKPIRLQLTKTAEKELESKNSVLVDKNLLFFPLIIRKWKTGDVFFPSGMNGKKKVSKYFKDEKMSLLEKENTWLLCSAKNEIIWIVGKRQDRRFKISENTNNIIKISIV